MFKLLPVCLLSLAVGSRKGQTEERKKKSFRSILHCTKFLSFIILIKIRRPCGIVGGFTNTPVFCRVGLRKQAIQQYVLIQVKMITVRLNITWDWICKFSSGKSYLSKLPLTILVRGEKGQGNKDRAQSWLGLGGAGGGVGGWLDSLHFCSRRVFTGTRKLPRFGLLTWHPWQQQLCLGSRNSFQLVFPNFQISGSKWGNECRIQCSCLLAEDYSVFHVKLL